MSRRLSPDSGSVKASGDIAYCPQVFEGLDYTDVASIYDGSQENGRLKSLLGITDSMIENPDVLSGGEKVRVVLAKMMLEGANCMIFDEPTSHLDLEAIQALNDGLINFSGTLLFNSHDHQFVDSVANRIIEFTPAGLIDRYTNFENYINDESVKAIRDKAYEGKHTVVLL